MTKKDVVDVIEKGSEPIVLADLLDDIVSSIKRHMHLGDHEIDLVAVWIAHTYIYMRDIHTPYLWITSPARRCGKSLLLEILEVLVRDPYKISGGSIAALTRIMNEKKPTLMLDEIDNQFLFGTEYVAKLSALLNDGWKQGANTAVVQRNKGGGFELEEFDSYVPKAFAGIGANLPEATLDRSIPIKLHAKPKEVKKQRFRIQYVGDGFAAIKEQLEVWDSETTCEELDVLTDQPEELSDRGQDIFEILFKIAKEAGPVWLKKVQEASVGVMNSMEESKPKGILLLEACWEVFESKSQKATQDPNRISSEMLVTELRRAGGGESIWGNDGSDLNATQLAKELKAFGVIRDTTTITINGTNIKGWKRPQFIKAWKSYCPDLITEPEPRNTGSSRNGVTTLTGVTGATPSEVQVGFSTQEGEVEY